MAKLTLRDRSDEQMDAEDLDPAVYARVMRDLARINRWTFTARPTLAYLKRATVGMSHFRLLDVGFGAGDMLRAIGRWAGRCGLTTELVGVDLNPRSAEVARSMDAQGLAINYHTGDYRDIEGPIDFIVSSQVAHHMTDEQLDSFIGHMESRAARGWLISDLYRHRFAHGGFPLLARVLRVHRIVREDGKLSIARGFRPEEWRWILVQAGITPQDVSIVGRFPFRLSVERVR